MGRSGALSPFASKEARLPPQTDGPPPPRSADNVPLRTRELGANRPRAPGRVFIYQRFQLVRYATLSIRGQSSLCVHRSTGVTLGRRGTVNGRYPGCPLGIAGSLDSVPISRQLQVEHVRTLESASFRGLRVSIRGEGVTARSLLTGDFELESLLCTVRQPGRVRDLVGT
jgi:hypothetical protein